MNESFALIIYYCSISALVSQTSFGGETSLSVAKCRLAIGKVCLFQVAVSMASTTSRAFVTQAIWERHATLITMTAVLLLVIMVLTHSLCYTPLQKLLGNGRCHFYDTVIVSVSIKKKENRNPGSNPDLSYPNLFLSTTTLPHRPAKILKHLSTCTSKLLHQ